MSGIVKPVFPRLQHSKNIASGLIACWPHWEGYGSQVSDVANGLHHGAITDAVWVDTVKGRALDFNGTSAKVVCDKIPEADGLSELTLSFWNYRAANNRHFIVGSYVSDNVRYEIIQYTTTLYADVSNGAAAYGSVTSNRTGWHHYLMSFDGSRSVNSRVELYVDNVKQSLSFTGSTPTTIPTTDTPFSIGERSGIYTNGMLTDIRLYNRDLSAKERRSVYERPYEVYAPKPSRVVYIVGTVSPGATLDQLSPGISQEINTAQSHTVTVDQLSPGVSQEINVAQSHTVTLDQTAPGVSQDIAVDHPHTATLDQTAPGVSQEIQAEAIQNVTLDQTAPGVSQEILILHTVVDIDQTAPGVSQDIEVDHPHTAILDQTAPGVSQDIEVDHPHTAILDQTAPGVWQQLVMAGVGAGAEGAKLKIGGKGTFGLNLDV